MRGRTNLNKIVTISVLKCIINFNKKNEEKTRADWFKIAFLYPD